MTLVVARQVGGTRIRIEADTRLIDTPGAVRQPREVEGALKAVIISPETCVAFAGRVPNASAALLALGQRSRQITDDEVVELLLRAHVDSYCEATSEYETDFLVASCGSDSRIVKIAKGQVETCLTQGWIGNAKAFSSFQKRYHEHAYSAPRSFELPPERRESFEVSSRMSNAFRGIVEEQEFPDVGDFVISIGSFEDGLKYLPKTEAYVGPAGAQQIPSGVLTQVQFGSAVQGGYTCALMTPSSAGIGAVGVHYLQAAFGVLWVPLRAAAPITIDGSYDVFAQRVAADYGIELIGIKPS